jgi:hypothetical protein
MLTRAAEGAKFYKGDIIDVDTEDGMERCALILGKPESGNPGEMMVKFADGVIQDWDIAEFVKLPPVAGPVVFTHHGPNIRLGWERREIRAPIATINSEPIDPNGRVVTILRGESEKGAGGAWEGTPVNVPKFRKVYESAVCGEPLSAGQHCKQSVFAPAYPPAEHSCHWSEPDLMFAAWSTMIIRCGGDMAGRSSTVVWRRWARLRPNDSKAAGAKHTWEVDEQHTWRSRRQRGPDRGRCAREHNGTQLRARQNRERRV